MAPYKSPACVCACARSVTVMSNSCDLMDSSMPDSFVLGIFQARILEWVAISFCRSTEVLEGFQICGLLCAAFSCLQLCPVKYDHLVATPWTIESMEFFRLEYWSGYLFLLQGIFPTQGSNPGLPHCGQICHQLMHKGSPWPF